jgi:hypothetical protein
VTQHGASSTFSAAIRIYFRLWSGSQEILDTDPEVPGSISGATRFSEK